MKFVIAAILLFFSVTANAEIAFPPMSITSPATVGPLNDLIIADQATGGCWTNLGEAKRYAEDRLRLKGYKIEPAKDELDRGIQYKMFILVHAERGAGGVCFGNIYVELFSLSRHLDNPLAEDDALWKFTVGRHVLASHGGVAINSDNLNEFVLDVIRKFTEAL